MIEKISQSFIKDFRGYLAGQECGLIIKAKYIDDRLLDDKEPGEKELGTYLEFLISGAVPKSGRVPVPIMMPSNPKKPIAKYRKAQVNAARVKEYFKAMGLVIIKANVRFTKGRYNGNLDLIVEFQGMPMPDGTTLDVFKFDNSITWTKGDRFCIDIKNSGLLKDQTPGYNKLGWKWSKTQKEYHGTQAKQYHFVSGLPFYFLVIQSNDEEDSLSEIRLFHVPITAAMIEGHVDEGNQLMEQFERMVRAGIGLNPKPSLKKCQKCPLNIECKSKHTFPHPELVDLETYEA